MKPTIVIVPYDDHWPALFDSERGALERINEGWFKAIHHIGSTSIPGMSAKPIIDILVSLRSDQAGELCADAMRQMGYAYRGDGGLPGRHFYLKADARHVHMWVESRPEYGRHLRFRDYLRAHPDEAYAYAQLKRQLAERFALDRAAYTQAKTDFCERIEALALARG